MTKEHIQNSFRSISDLEGQRSSIAVVCHGLRHTDGAESRARRPRRSVAHSVHTGQRKIICQPKDRFYHVFLLVMTTP